jgi:hypothetical protein
MTLVAGKLHLHTAACVPCTIDPAVSSCLPVVVGYAVAFSAEHNGLIAGNLAAVVINIGFQIGTIMAVETAQIQSVIKNHVPVCTEGQMKCTRCIEILVTLACRGLFLNMADIASIKKLIKIKLQARFTANRGVIKPVPRRRDCLLCIRTSRIGVFIHHCRGGGHDQAARCKA